MEQERKGWNWGAESGGQRPAEARGKEIEPVGNIGRE